MTSISPAHQPQDHPQPLPHTQRTRSPTLAEPVPDTLQLTIGVRQKKARAALHHVSEHEHPTGDQFEDRPIEGPDHYAAHLQPTNIFHDHLMSMLTDTRTTIDQITDKIHHRIHTIDQHGKNAGLDFELCVLTNDDDEEDDIPLQERLITVPH